MANTLSKGARTLLDRFVVLDVTKALPDHGVDVTEPAGKSSVSVCRQLDERLVPPGVVPLAGRSEGGASGSRAGDPDEADGSIRIDEERQLELVAPAQLM
jgi:hypothetical protein